MNMYVGRLYVLMGLTALGVLASPPAAFAQYRSEASSVVGEKYHIEAAFAFWDAEPSLVINSESLGILGDDIDLTSDLGILKKRLRKFNVVLRPATKHKLKFERLPIKYEADVLVSRSFVFNGQRYNLGLPVQTSVDFSTYRFGYEYDFLYLPRGYVGGGVDLRYTNVDVQLLSPIGREFLETAAPIPSFGFMGRGYVTRNLAVDAELSLFRVPDNLAEQFEGDGSYTDFDLKGTYNFTRNVGAVVGYRRTNIFYDIDLDTGTLKFSGMYFGGVVRY